MHEREASAAWAALNRTLELPLIGLGELTELRRTLDRIERQLVDAARLNWSSWEEIGGALGISRQAAHTRYRRFVEARTRAGTDPLA